MSAARVLLALAAAVVAALIGAFVYTSFERVEITVEQGYQGEARFNHLLAAERLARALGARADGVRGYPSLGDGTGTVVWGTTRRYLSPRQHERLLAWVESGGHLVVAAHPAARGRLDPLLGGLGFSLDEDTGGDGRVRTADGLEVEFTHAARTLGIPRGARVLAGEPGAIRAAALRRGAGRIVVLSDDGPFHNSRIGKLDHAAFFWQVARPSGDDAVVLVYAEAPPRLLALALDRAPAVIAAGAVLLAVWLWSASRRFGPLLPDPPPGRRRLMEHVEASGRLLWSAGAGQVLLEDVRASLLRTLEHRHPGWQRGPGLTRRLAESSGLPEAEVESALHGSAADATSFARRVWSCETLRRSL